MRELTPIERFAVEQALYSALGSDVRTGRSDNLRGEVDAFYHDQLTHAGADRFRVTVGDRVAGTYRFDRRDGGVRLAVTDMDALQSWEDDDFDAFCSRWVLDHIDALAGEYFKATGVVPDGCEARREPGTVKGVYTPDRGLVGELRAHLLEGGIMGLLAE